MPRKLDETWQLLDDFAEATRLLHNEEEHDDAVLHALCELTLKTLSADHAAVTLVRKEKTQVVSATSDLPEQAELVRQSVLGVPWSELVGEDGVLRIDDLAARSRWPDFEAAVGALGVRSILVRVLSVQAGAVAVLTVYSARPDAFTAEHETVTAILGGTISSTLRAARQQEQLTNLNLALRTSRRIGVALGILMAVRRIDLDSAWELLASTSQNRNVKVSVLAEDVIATGTFPDRPASRPAGQEPVNAARLTG